jgi:hypothetical protein
MELIDLADAMPDSEDGRSALVENYETKPPSSLFSIMTPTTLVMQSAELLDGLLEQRQAGETRRPRERGHRELPS